MYIYSTLKYGMNQIHHPQPIANKPRWKPNTTVAAIIERDGQFLMVEEYSDQGLLLNQPAGHLDQGETLVDAVTREAQEETAHHFTPTALVGIYKWRSEAADITYLRFAFAGEVGARNAEQTLDDGIARAVWMTPAEIEASRPRHRSPYVWTCIKDYMAGNRYPLALLREFAEE
jgi:8-oxo-dGTP pyrophosphatase MutT (NUDIX family)